VKKETIKRWLITGGCGFIGSSLVKSLMSEQGHFIRVLDNLSVGSREDLARVCTFKEVGTQSSAEHSVSEENTPNDRSLCELLVGDIREFELCLKATEGIDIIVHLAANTGVAPSVENPKADMEVNVIGTFNLLEAARHNGVEIFVFASSGAPVGECIPPIHEELAPHPVSPYGASKLAGEAYCSAYFRTYEIRTTALRFGNVYGPGSGHKNSVIAKFIKNALNGDVCEIYGDGNQTRDFIYIGDLIRAIRMAAYPQKPVSGSPSLRRSSGQSKSNPWGETFQIATSKEHTVNEVAQILKRQMRKIGGLQVEIKYGSPRLGDVKRNYSDTSKAFRVLGWQAKVDLEEGLKKTITYFEKSRTKGS
jgi:UDP-glucose 4-epimerase